MPLTLLCNDLKHDAKEEMRGQLSPIRVSVRNMGVPPPTSVPPPYGWPHPTCVYRYR